MRLLTKQGMKSMVLLIATIAALWACGGEKDIPIISDDNEILAYLAHSNDAVELFRTEGFFNGVAYTVPEDDGAIYADFLDSVIRDVDIELTPVGTIMDYSAYGNGISRTKDAEVRVIDRFFVTTRRTTDIGTTETSAVRRLIRYGLFLKRGSDAELFVGWQLFGYNGGGPIPTATLSIMPIGGTTFFGDNRVYARLNVIAYVTRSFFVLDTVIISPDSARIDTVGEEFGTFAEPASTQYDYMLLVNTGFAKPGASLVLVGGNIAAQSRYQLVSAESATGLTTMRMNRPIIGQYIDTLVAPGSSQNLWKIIFMQELTGRTPPYAPWCVPYRLRN